MKTVSFTDEEIVAARQMLEIALKTMGRQAVNAFSILDSKLAQATPAVEPELDKSDG